MMKDQESTSVERLAVYPIKFNKNANASHYLYLKPHKVRNSAPEKPTDRTLLVLGVPPYVNHECMRRLFSHCAEIDNIFFQKKLSSGPPPVEKDSIFKNRDIIKGFKVAYVVFKEEESVHTAMNYDYKEPAILSTKKHPIVTGLRKWMMEYNSKIYDQDALQSKVDTYMAEYDMQTEGKKLLEKEQEGIPDEDGWITVTRNKHITTAPHLETVNKKALKKAAKKREEKELMNFYAFQIRETKRDHINQLRLKFEEDKKRIRAMKEARRFRPY